MVSAVAAIWLPDTQRFFMELIEHYDYEGTATTKRHGFSVRFFRPFCSQTGRIRRNFNCSNYEKFEESYAQLLGILNKLRWHGEVGRPRFLVSFQLFSGRHVVLPGTPEHGTPEHRNITEHSGTPPKNPEHSQENQEHPKKTRNTPKKNRNTPRKLETPPRKPGKPQKNRKSAKSERIKRKGDFMYACKNEENAKMKIRTMNRNNLRANFSNRQTPGGRRWKIDFSLLSSTYSP